MPKNVNVSLKLQGFDGCLCAVKKLKKPHNPPQRLLERVCIFCPKRKKFRRLRKNGKPLLEKFSAGV